jgi:hypothetical protein
MPPTATPAKSSNIADDIPHSVCFDKKADNLSTILIPNIYANEYQCIGNPKTEKATLEKLQTKIASG